MFTIKNIIRIAFVSIIILLTACEKLLDFVPNKAVKDCRIKKIVFFPDDPPSLYRPYSMTFCYNKWGNPDSIILNPSQGENYHLYFVYNNKKQLIELREAYAFGFPILLHRFSYTRGLITTDSAVSFYTHIPYYHVTYFEYDRYGRMSKSTFIPTGQPPEYSTPITYQYDEEGNLISPNQTLNYDHKLNPRQLHPIWLFLSRDYSVNNPLTAVRYNNFGLPTKFESAPPFPFFSHFPFLGNSLNDLGNSEITYDCK